MYLNKGYNAVQYLSYLFLTSSSKTRIPSQNKLNKYSCKLSIHIAKKIDI